MKRRSTAVVEIRIVTVQKRMQPADFKKMECMNMIIPENYLSIAGMMLIKTFGYRLSSDTPAV